MSDKVECEICKRTKLQSCMNDPGGLDCDLRWPQSTIWHWKIGYEREKAKRVEADLKVAQLEMKLAIANHEVGSITRLTDVIRRRMRKALKELFAVWDERPRNFEKAQKKADKLTTIIDQIRDLAAESEDVVVSASPAQQDMKCTWQAPYCCGKPAVSRLIWIGPPEVQHSDAPAFCVHHDALYQKTNNNWWRREVLSITTPHEERSDAAR